MKDIEHTHNARLMGWASAVADGYRMHGCCTTVKDLMNASGITVDDLKKAGVEDYDLKMIKRVYGD